MSLLRLTLFTAMLISKSLAYAGACEDAVQRASAKPLVIEEISWSAERVISEKPYTGVTEFLNPTTQINHQQVPLPSLLPELVSKTLGKAMNFNCFSGAMNYFFPGFGLRPLNPKFAGRFHEMLGLLFKNVVKDDLQLGDMIVTHIGMGTFDHAMIYIGKGIVWQKPSATIPAGFFSLSEILEVTGKGLPQGMFSVNYYRFSPGNPADRFSKQLRADIERAKAASDANEAEAIMHRWFE